MAKICTALILTIMFPLLNLLQPLKCQEPDKEPDKWQPGKKYYKKHNGENGAIVRREHLFKKPENQLPGEIPAKLKRKYHLQHPIDAALPGNLNFVQISSDSNSKHIADLHSNRHHNNRIKRQLTTDVESTVTKEQAQDKIQQRVRRQYHPGTGLDDAIDNPTQAPAGLYANDEDKTRLSASSDKLIQEKILETDAKKQKFKNDQAFTDPDNAEPGTPDTLRWNDDRAIPFEKPEECQPCKSDGQFKKSSVGMHSFTTVSRINSAKKRTSNNLSINQIIDPEIANRVVDVNAPETGEITSPLDAIKGSSYVEANQPQSFDIDVNRKDFVLKGSNREKQEPTSVQDVPNPISNPVVLQATTFDANEGRFKLEFTPQMFAINPALFLPQNGHHLSSSIDNKKNMASFIAKHNAKKEHQSSKIKKHISSKATEGNEKENSSAYQSSKDVAVSSQKSSVQELEYRLAAPTEIKLSRQIEFRRNQRLKQETARNSAFLQLAHLKFAEERGLPIIAGMPGSLLTEEQPKGPTIKQENTSTGTTKCKKTTPPKPALVSPSESTPEDVLKFLDNAPPQSGVPDCVKQTASKALQALESVKPNTILNDALKVSTSATTAVANKVPIIVPDLNFEMPKSRDNSAVESSAETINISTKATLQELVSKINEKTKDTKETNELPNAKALSGGLMQSTKVVKVAANDFARQLLKKVVDDAGLNPGNEDVIIMTDEAAQLHQKDVDNSKPATIGNHHSRHKGKHSDGKADITSSNDEDEGLDGDQLDESAKMKGGVKSDVETNYRDDSNDDGSGKENSKEMIELDKMYKDRSIEKEDSEEQKLAASVKTPLKRNSVDSHLDKRTVKMADKLKSKSRVIIDRIRGNDHQLDHLNYDAVKKSNAESTTDVVAQAKTIVASRQTRASFGRILTWNVQHLGSCLKEKDIEPLREATCVILLSSNVIALQNAEHLDLSCLPCNNELKNEYEWPGEGSTEELKILIRTSHTRQFSVKKLRKCDDEPTDKKRHHLANVVDNDHEQMKEQVPNYRGADGQADENFLEMKETEAKRDKKAFKEFVDKFLNETDSVLDRTKNFTEMDVHKQTGIRRSDSVASNRTFKMSSKLDKFKDKQLHKNEIKKSHIYKPTHFVNVTGNVLSEEYILTSDDLSFAPLTLNHPKLLHKTGDKKDMFTEKRGENTMNKKNISYALLTIRADLNRAEEFIFANVRLPKKKDLRRACYEKLLSDVSNVKSEMKVTNRNPKILMLGDFRIDQAEGADIQGSLLKMLINTQIDGENFHSALTYNPTDPITTLNGRRWDNIMTNGDLSGDLKMIGPDLPLEPESYEMPLTLQRLYNNYMVAQYTQDGNESARIYDCMKAFQLAGKEQLENVVCRDTWVPSSFLSDHLPIAVKISITTQGKSSIEIRMASWNIDGGDLKKRLRDPVARYAFLTYLKKHHFVVFHEFPKYDRVLDNEELEGSDIIRMKQGKVETEFGIFLNAEVKDGDPDMFVLKNTNDGDEEYSNPTSEESIGFITTVGLFVAKITIDQEAAQGCMYMLTLHEKDINLQKAMEKIIPAIQRDTVRRTECRFKMLVASLHAAPDFDVDGSIYRQFKIIHLQCMMGGDQNTHRYVKDEVNTLHDYVIILDTDEGVAVEECVIELPGDEAKRGFEQISDFKELSNHFPLSINLGKNH